MDYCRQSREIRRPLMPEAGLAVDLVKRPALAETIGRLLGRGPKWDRWSVQARRRYEEQFTAEHFRRRLLGTLMEELRVAG